MSRLKDDDVLDARMALATLHLGDMSLDDEVAPRGLRLLRRVSRLTPDVAASIVERFGGLARLQRATIDDLAAVEGVDAEIAVSVKETLERVTENTILGQYS
jgi:diadenylate cyclase